MKKKLPIGVDNFEELIRENFYYADKTMMIAELLHNWGKVNLFTRPRRFGKSLNMSMLKAFFEIGCDRTLFDGLKISEEKDLCDRYMGQFPIISITLKGVDRLTYREAFCALRDIIGTEALRFQFLLESSRLSDREKEIYQALINLRDGEFTMNSELLMTSLQKLSALLAHHFERKVIILIDEYDVPLDKAFQAGTSETYESAAALSDRGVQAADSPGGSYYQEMVSLLRNLFGNALKTNDHLQFAVLTGCLQISKESIFTGLNNLNVMTITDSWFSDSFGFTEQNVKELLSYYEMEDALETVREWYDGYLFGGTSVYCPWDVIKYVQALQKDRNAGPKNYWANTSGNALIRRFIGKADRRTKSEIERLIAGESIVRMVNQELTYSELDSSIENLWSVLFITGYLTQKGQEGSEDGRERYRLLIPNREVRSLFISQIQVWFQDKKG